MEKQSETSSQKRKWIVLLILLFLVVFIATGIVTFLKDNGKSENISDYKEEQKQEKQEKTSYENEITNEVTESNRESKVLVKTLAKEKELNGKSSTATETQTSNGGGNGVPADVPRLNITYSTKKITNQDVVVKIESDEKVQLVPGWTYANEKETIIEKTYSENTVEDVIVKNIVDNQKTVNIKVENIDKVLPTITISDFKGNRNIYREISFDLKDNYNLVKATVNGEAFLRTGKNATLEYQDIKQYLVQGENTILLHDEAGNVSEFKFMYDTVAPTAVITYSITNITNQDVVVTLTASEEIILDSTASAWLDKGGNVFEKTYSQNATEVIKFKDVAGNDGSASIVINNIDKVPPTATVTYSTIMATNQDVFVTLNASEKIIIDSSSTGWTALVGNSFRKQYSANISELVKFKDVAGNDGSVTVSISNIDKEKPKLKVNGSSTVILEAGIDTYVEENATMTDNVDQTINNLGPSSIEYVLGGVNRGVVPDVDTSKVGTYLVKYTYTDTAGNIGVDELDNTMNYTMRTVNVVDTTAPKISINGQKTINLEKGVDTYIEENATMTDNVDQTINNLGPSSIEYILGGVNKGVVPSVDTSKVGTYLVKYTYTDAAGNIGVDELNNTINYAVRTVNVIDTIAPTINVSYSNTSITNQNIIATITANEEIQLVSGWTYANTEKTIITKTYTSNATETVEVKDLYDNKSNANISITNIDKGLPTIRISASEGTEGHYKSISLKISDAEGNLEKALINGVEYLRTGEINDLNYGNIVGSLIQGENVAVVYDKAGNTSELRFIYDTVAPTTADLTYSTTDLTNQDVIATITSNEAIQLVSGWTYANTEKTIITKTYTSNATEAVEVKDLAGNSYGAVNVSIANIDKGVPTISITASEGTEGHYKSISLKISDAEGNLEKALINGVEYLRTGEINDLNYGNIVGSLIQGENVAVVYDKAGNTSELRFIYDTVAPTTADLTYSTTDLTNQDVIATITSNEAIQLVSGWTYANTEKTIITKTYTSNATEAVEVKDLAGNSYGAVNVSITNIDKGVPTITLTDTFRISFTVEDAEGNLDRVIINGVVLNSSGTSMNYEYNDILTYLVKRKK